jgi:hypothetical protein
VFFVLFNLVNESSIFIIIMYHLELTPDSYELNHLFLCVCVISVVMMHLVPNRVLHRHLNVLLVSELASTRYKSFHSSFHLHDNPLVQALSSLTLPQNPPRRLNRHWPRDFLRE